MSTQYVTFMRGMLDITDNLVDGTVVHPDRRARPRRRRSLPRRRRRQGHGDVLRHGQRGQPGVRLLARRCVRERWLPGLRPQGARHHRARRVGVGEAPFPRARHRRHDRAVHRGRHRRHVGRRVRQRHALHAPDQARLRVRPSPRVRRSRSRPRRRRSRSADGCSRRPARPGTTTTDPCCRRGPTCSIATRRA